METVMETVADVPLWEEDPFSSPPPDEETQLRLLTRVLQMAQGFHLYFVSVNQSGHRDRLMEALQSRLPNLHFQKVPLFEPERNLLYLFRECLEEPLPSAVFVYGLESWMAGTDKPKSIPFILNLNVTRNHLLKELPCPLIFWVPQHILTAISHGAPDFFSVRSGVYFFSAPPQVREQMMEMLTSEEQIGVAGLPYEEKWERIASLTEILHEYEALPEAQRDYLAEARILNSLAIVYQVLGQYASAEPLFQKALAIREKLLGTDHPNTVISLNNLAILYRSQGRYQEAEPLFLQALEINEKTLEADHPSIAISLNNLALLYHSQGRYQKTEPLYQRALAINEKTLGTDHFDTAISLNNLAGLYESQGRYQEAIPLSQRALVINEKTLGADHPDTAISLNNLAGIYESQGRYQEAEPLYRRASAIMEKMLGVNHPLAQAVRVNYEMCLQEMRKELGVTA